MEVTFLTWNLKGSEGPDTDLVVEHARAVGADVVALQEVQRHQARAVARGLGAASVGWGFKHWPLRTWPEGMAIIGVTRPVEVRTHALSFRLRLWSWRRRIFQVALVQPGGTSVTLANTHLSPHGDAGIRVEEVETVLEEIGAAPGPVVIVGDLNDRPGATIFLTFEKVGFHDAWATLHPGGSEADGATNWRGWRPGTTDAPGRRLDYILVRGHARVVRVVIPRHDERGFDRFARLSDHLPVAATLAFEPATSDAGDAS